jgi:hypothetical protein
MWTSDITSDCYKLPYRKSVQDIVEKFLYLDIQCRYQNIPKKVQCITNATLIGIHNNKRQI